MVKYVPDHRTASLIAFVKHRNEYQYHIDKMEEIEEKNNIHMMHHDNAVNHWSEMRHIEEEFPNDVVMPNRRH